MLAPELRLVLAVSLDGRLAAPAGGAAQLGGPGDRRVLEEALAWADACLIGANTLRLHGCTCLIHRPELLEQRRRDQRPPQPAAVVVSRTARFDPALAFFAQPLQRLLLMAEPSRRSGPVPGFDRCCSLDTWPAALAALAEQGLMRLLVLGGAQLAGSLLEQQLVDELQLTLCPQLLGGAHSWVPAAALLPTNRWQLLEQQPLEGQELMLRYRRLRV